LEEDQKLSKPGREPGRAEQKFRPSPPPLVLSLMSDRQDDKDNKSDAQTRLACEIHAHILLLFRNWDGPRSLGEEDVQLVISSFVFLTTRHSRNKYESDLAIPETEIVHIFHGLRSKLIEVVDASSSVARSNLMENVISTISNKNESKKAEISLPDSAVHSTHIFSTETKNTWGVLEGLQNKGRYTIATEGSDDMKISSETALSVEINLQFGQVTLRSSHLTALDSKISNHPDSKIVFSSTDSMQCASILRAQHLKKLRLVGRGHTINAWDSDPR